MKTAEEILKKNNVISMTEGQYRFATLEGIYEAMEEYATEQTAKWRELNEAQKEYFEHLENMLRVHGYYMTGQPLTKSLGLRQKISKIEKELGLKE
jgi:isoaspartyl peptidase/L-asparaginase-like protein (Ntn-hydrolase superfamily)